MIKFDKSWNSILVQCEECPYWFSLQLDMPAAYRSAGQHRVIAHDEEPRRANEPLRLWEKRHAADS
jgi:hypothetical protein